MTLLKTRKLSKTFGSLRAVDSVDIQVGEGRIYSIIGPNGAGKTTLFNLISGHLDSTEGTIFFKNNEITGLPPFRISRLGIGRSFQLNNNFPLLTVFENIRLAAQSKHHARFSLFSRVDRHEEVLDKAYEVMGKVRLSEHSDKVVEFLSHGDKRLLEIGIAIATEPELLLLDEPTSGLAPDETSKMVQLIKTLSEDLTIVLIEHKMSVVMTVSDEIIVMHQGTVLIKGPPDIVQKSPEVKRAYLGGSSNAGN